MIGYTLFQNTHYLTIFTSFSVSIQTSAPHDRGLSGLYTTLLFPCISTSLAYVLLLYVLTVNTALSSLFFLLLLMMCWLTCMIVFKLIVSSLLYMFYCFLSSLPLLLVFDYVLLLLLYSLVLHYILCCIFSFLL
jgi:hypothetical protein